MNFKESDKVVYVKEVNWDNRWRLLGEFPQFNHVYVVKRVYGPSRLGQFGLILVGSSCIFRQTETEVGWNALAFRKLEDIQAENAPGEEDKKLLEEARKLINLY